MKIFFLSLVVSVASSPALARAPMGATDPDGYASVAAAVAVACNGTTPGHVLLPRGTIPVLATLSIPANCRVEGHGSRQTILQATSATTGVVFNVSGSTTLSNFAVDGNRSANSHSLACMLLTGSSIELSGMAIKNCQLHGIQIAGSSSRIAIHDSEISDNGNANASVQIGAGIIVAPGDATISQIQLGPNLRVHDNNTGIEILNSSQATNAVDDVVVRASEIYSNANDGIEATAYQAPGGPIRRFHAEDNSIYCNGWPANGIGLSTKCKPGFQQNGPTSSGGGVGVDLIQNGFRLMQQPVVSGNRIHDNVFEAVATATQAFSQVTVLGTAVTWVSGSSRFDPSWKPGTSITILQTPFQIASVIDATHLTLSTAPGSRYSSGGLAGPSLMGATITLNQSDGNGNATMQVGPGFYNQFSDGNTYSGNIARGNQYDGFENFLGNDITYTGDESYSNGLSLSGGRRNGFWNYYGTGVQYHGVTTDDKTPAPSQTTGILNQTPAVTIIDSTAIRGTAAKILDTLTPSRREQ